MKLTGGQVLGILREWGIELNSTTLGRWASYRLIPSSTARSKTSKRKDDWSQETIHHAVVAHFFLKRKPPKGRGLGPPHLRAKTWSMGEVYVGRNLGLELLSLKFVFASL